MAEAAKRDFYIDEIKRLNEMLQKESVLNKLDPFELDEYINVLESNFLMVRNENVDLMCDKNLGETRMNQIKTEYNEVEGIFISLKAKLRSQSENLMPKLVMAPSKISEQPEVIINWDKFSGEYDKWLEFYAKFGKALDIHSHWSEAKKLEILIDSTEGDAKALVIQFESFEKAWEALRMLYDNAFRHAHAEIKAVMNIKAIERRSIEAITSLIQQVDNHVEKLKAVYARQNFEALIPLLIVDKFDEETKKAWYDSLASFAHAWAQSGGTTATMINNAMKFIPFWSNMRDFLEIEIHKLNEANDTRSISDAGACGRNAANQGMKKEYCSLCGSLHRLYKCNEFRAKTMDDRWDHVKSHGLCERCLRLPHEGRCFDPTNNNPCVACKPQINYHNSTLCSKFRANSQAYIRKI